MLSSILPPPKNTHYNQAIPPPPRPPLPPNITNSNNNYINKNNNIINVNQIENNNSTSKNIPQYPNRKGFTPIDIDDYNDGGSYPEIHMVQYPLNMGRPGFKGSSSSSTSLVAIQVDEKGNLRTDILIKQGSNRNKIIQSQLSDIKEKVVDDMNMIALPEEKDMMETAEKTKIALESLISSKIASAKPSTVVNTNEIPEPTYIRYTPNPDAPGYNPTAKQRVIKMVEEQIDPMEPPKHKHTKAPRGPPSPPVPILHSPPRKITVADQQAWKIPPCVSNWKNARGFIIPLDKRLAADGRGLQEVTINNKFAMVSEALFIAERKATEDLKIRNDIRKKMALKEKEEREMSLREMANRARMERAGIKTTGLNDDIDDDEGGDNKTNNNNNNNGVASRSGQYDNRGNDSTRINDSRGNDSRFNDSRGNDNRRDENRNVQQSNNNNNNNNRYDDKYNGREHTRDDRSDDDDSDEGTNFKGESEQDQIARQQRERIRMERRKERERELRLDNMKGNMRKNKIDRDEGRDISEKIALGMLKGTGGKLTGESLYDSRLFNQSSGMDAGFGNEDEYNTYSKPLFDRDGNNKNGNTSIYHPKKNDDDIYGDADKQLNDLTNTSRFRADKGFKGTSTTTNEKRDGPVQFEKSSSSSSSSSSIHQSKHYDRDDDRRQSRHHDDDDNDRYDNRTSSSSRGGKQRGRDDDDRDDPFGINDIIDHKKSRRD